MKIYIKSLILLIGLYGFHLIGNATSVNLHQKFTGNINYSVIGASELQETGGYWNCTGTDNNSATLSHPASATVKAAYLYWYVMESNNTDDTIPYIAISNTAPVTFPGAGSAINISSTRNFNETVPEPVSGGTYSYAGRFVDISLQVKALSNASGTYRVDVQGGASTSACAYAQENVRGWNIIVVYEDSTTITNPYSINIYDGMVGFLDSSISVPVSGYEVLASPTAGSLTVVSIQGDLTIPGEYMASTDPVFPGFPSDYANGNPGPALDIDTVNGNFTAGSTSMTLNAGSDGDLILLTNIVLRIPDALAITIINDYGDAAASYGDAIHTIPTSPILYLGSTVPDDESSSQSTVNADGDDNNDTDDEDGITSPSTPWVTNSSESLSVDIMGNGYLNAWIDWNLDGDFTDAGEQISNESPVSTGTVNLSVAIPVNATNGDLPARFRLCSTAGDCNTPTGQATDGEVEDYLISVVSCTSLSGDVSETAAAIPFQVASGDKVFVASNSPLPSIAGHLKAYSVQANGSIGTTVAWDAATLMDTTKREAGLYSTNVSGTKVLFNSNSFDDAAFSSSGSPTVAKIKEYTITPSIDSGVYLAGRASGSWLGPMSRGNDVALLTQMNNMGQFLTDSAYRSFYNGTISSRSEKILVSSDDGFLYAFDQSTGQLSWGWMPRTLAAELKNYSSFQSQGYMRGTVDIIDAKDSSGNYATYVIGSYKDGLGQYALKLNSSGGLGSVVWDQDYSGSYSSAPNHGEKDYFRDGSELTYVTYVVTNSSNQSTVVLREITTAATNTEVAVTFNATSTPYVIQDFGDSNGPAAKTLYLGDESGNIQRTALLDSGSLETAANLKSALEGSSVGNLNASEPILFLGASSSNTGGQYYLRAQSEFRLTLLDYNSSTTNWDKRWTSYVGGAGSWDASNIYTADNSGVPTDVDNDGFFTNVTANGIQSLPADARITDAAQIVANNVILPVSVQTAGSCFGKAYFYLYNLTNGVFPDNKLMNLDSSKITTNIALGYGDPSRVSIADMPSTEYMLGYGLTDQNKDNDVEINEPFRINDRISTGIRGWKERRQE